MRKPHFIIHLLTWAGLYVFWILVFQKRELAFSQTATVGFCYVLFITANYYFNTLINIPRFLQKKNYLIFLLLFSTAIAVTALLRVPLAMFLNKNYFIPNAPQPDFVNTFSSSVLNISIWVIGIVAAKISIDRFKFQQYLDEVKKQKEMVELDFLNAQFNPHFLFNSINSIYGHIDKQNTKARNMILTFSDMLRYQLYECNENIIPVEKELNYIRNYVSLQRVRKSEGLRIKFDIADDVNAFNISPLLFVAFIENCFKYCGSGDEDGEFVKISFSKENNFLLFVCENSKAIISVAKEEKKGIGLSNARRRLELLYPGKHELKIKEDEKVFRVTLKIQVE